MAAMHVDRQILEEDLVFEATVDTTTRLLIRLQRIYNFLLSHAIILSVLDVLYAFICYFI